MPQYLYMLKANDPAKAASQANWAPEDEETFNLHWANLERMKDERALLMAGGAQDADGTGPAFVIFEAGSDEEAQSVFEAEPFVTRGFATATLHPFNVALSRNEL